MPVSSLTRPKKVKNKPVIIKDGDKSYELKKIILHDIQKEKNLPIEDKIKASKLLELEKGAKRLFKALVSEFGKSGSSVYNGTFNNEENGIKTRTDFEAYLTSDQKDVINFIILSHNIYDKIYHQASENLTTSGGFICQAEYISRGNHYILVAMLRPIPGISIQNLTPKAFEAIETGKIYQMARINVNKYNEILSATEENNDEISYLQFATPQRNRETSGYFIRALGCKRGSSSMSASKSLISAIKHFSNNSEHVTQQNKVAVNAALSDKISDIVSLRGDNKRQINFNDFEDALKNVFPNTIDGDKHKAVIEFIELINSDDFGVPPEFNLHVKTATSFLKIVVEAEHWSMKIDRALLGTDETSPIQLFKDDRYLLIKNLSVDQIKHLLKEIAES